MHHVKDRQRFGEEEYCGCIAWLKCVEWVKKQHYEVEIFIIFSIIIFWKQIQPDGRSPHCSDCWGSWCSSSSPPCPQPDLWPPAACTGSYGSPGTVKKKKKEKHKWTEMNIITNKSLEWLHSCLHTQHIAGGSLTFKIIKKWAQEEKNKALTASRFMMVWPVSPKSGFLKRTLNSGHG